MKRRAAKELDTQFQKSTSKPKSIKKVMASLTGEIIDASNKIDSNNLTPLLNAYKQSFKHPILQTLTPQPEIFRTNPDRKKKPIEQYLDTVNSLYKKRDLDLLINPVNTFSAYQLWNPREVAIFEAAIVRFGNQFDLISEMVESKSVKECYAFYWEWKNTSHYRAYKTNQNFMNRSSYEPLM